MILYNPTNKELKIKHKGIEYSIEAYGELEVSDETGAHWKDTIHQFLIAKKDKASSKKVEKPEEAKVEEVSDVTTTEDTEITEEEVKEKPSKK